MYNCLQLPRDVTTPEFTRTSFSSDSKNMYVYDGEFLRKYEIGNLDTLEFTRRVSIRSFDSFEFPTSRSDRFGQYEDISFTAQDGSTVTRLFVRKAPPSSGDDILYGFLTRPNGTKIWSIITTARRFNTTHKGLRFVYEGGNRVHVASYSDNFDEVTTATIEFNPNDRNGLLDDSFVSGGFPITIQTQFDQAGMGDIDVFNYDFHQFGNTVDFAFAHTEGVSYFRTVNRNQPRSVKHEEFLATGVAIRNAGFRTALLVQGDTIVSGRYTEQTFAPLDEGTVHQYSYFLSGEKRLNNFADFETNSSPMLDVSSRYVGYCRSSDGRFTNENLASITNVRDSTDVQPFVSNSVSGDGVAHYNGSDTELVTWRATSSTLFLNFYRDFFRSPEESNLVRSWFISNSDGTRFIIYHPQTKKLLRYTDSINESQLFIYDFDINSGRTPQIERIFRNGLQERIFYNNEIPLRKGLVFSPNGRSFLTFADNRFDQNRVIEYDIERPYDISTRKIRTVTNTEVAAFDRDIYYSQRDGNYIVCRPQSDGYQMVVYVNKPSSDVVVENGTAIRNAGDVINNSQNVVDIEGLSETVDDANNAITEILEDVDATVEDINEAINDAQETLENLQNDIDQRREEAEEEGDAATALILGALADSIELVNQTIEDADNQLQEAVSDALLTFDEVSQEILDEIAQQLENAQQQFDEISNAVIDAATEISEEILPVAIRAEIEQDGSATLIGQLINNNNTSVTADFVFNLSTEFDAATNDVPNDFNFFDKSIIVPASSTVEVTETTPRLARPQNFFFQVDTLDK